MSFTKRKIELAFQLMDGTRFAGTNSNIITLSGLRCSVSIVKSGGAGMTTTQLRVFGLSPSLMAQLGTYGAPPDAATSTVVQVSAGDDEAGLAVVAVGNIQSAMADYAQAPEVAFSITAFTGLVDAIKPAKPTSINGGADCARIVESLAKIMGYQFENNGVNVRVSHPYLSGSARMQVQEIAEAGEFNWVIDHKTLAIWPKNGFRAGVPVVFSPATGMVGFPTFTTQGVIVKALLNPAVKYGQQIKVESSLQPACGLWNVINLSYELQSETPNGAWFMTMEALSPNYSESVNAP